jgi:hypothetical protein
MRKKSITNDRVAIYSPYSVTTPGAASVRVRAIEESFTHAGKQVRIFTPADGSGPRLLHALTTYSPGIIVATSPPLPPLAWVWAASWASGSLFILDAKDDGRAIELLHKKNTHQPVSLKEKAFLHLRKFLYENADHIWFLTHGDCHEAMGHYSIQASRACVVMNGPDPRIQFSIKARTKIRAEWSVSAKQGVVTYAGSMGDEDLLGFIEHIPAKSKLFYVFAFAFDHSPSTLSTRKKIYDALAHHNIPHRIYENISAEEMSEIFSGADIGIVPWRDSLLTSIPVKTFDYAGTGLAIIAKCPAHGELDALLAREKTWGVSIPEWKQLGKALTKYAIPRDSKTRASLGKKVHTTWDRVSQFKGPVSQVVLDWK